MYQKSSDSDEGARADVLASAGEQIATSGLKGLTLRSLAQNTGISPSLLTYRYGTRENLIRQVFDHVQAAEEAFWAARKVELQGLLEHPAQLLSLALSIADLASADGATTTRLGWKAMTAAERMPSLEPVMSGWPGLATDFWKNCFADMGIAPSLAPAFAAGMTGALRIGVLAKADLQIRIWQKDVIVRLCDRIKGGSLTAPGDSAARLALEALGRRQTGSLPDSRGETPIRIIKAASELILAHGPEALTHRLIARHSGISLSSMTHHFQSLEQIMLLAFNEIYAYASRESSVGLPPTSTIASMCETVLPMVFERARRRGSEAVALDEIILASSRKPNSPLSAGALLAITGRTSTALIQSVDTIGSRADRLDGQVFRFILTGLAEQVASLPAGDRDRWMTDQCRAFLQAGWS